MQTLERDIDSRFTAKVFVFSNPTIPHGPLPSSQFINGQFWPTAQILSGLAKAQNGKNLVPLSL